MPGRKRETIATIGARALQRVLERAGPDAVHDRRLGHVVAERAEAPGRRQAPGQEEGADGGNDRDAAGRWRLSCRTPGSRSGSAAPCRGRSRSSLKDAPAPIRKGLRLSCEKTPTIPRVTFLGSAPSVRWPSSSTPSVRVASPRGRSSCRAGATTSGAEATLSPDAASCARAAPAHPAQISAQPTAVSFVKTASVRLSNDASRLRSRRPARTCRRITGCSGSRCAGRGSRPGRSEARRTGARASHATIAPVSSDERDA